MRFISRVRIPAGASTARRQRIAGVLDSSERRSLKALNGALSIDSQPKRGTIIHARFLSIQAAIPCVLPGKPCKLDFFVHLIGGFISGLQES
jgi:hypothetical protein